MLSFFVSWFVLFSHFKISACFVRLRQILSVTVCLSMCMHYISILIHTRIQNYPPDFHALLLVNDDLSIGRPKLTFRPSCDTSCTCSYTFYATCIAENLSIRNFVGTYRDSTRDNYLLISKHRARNLSLRMHIQFNFATWKTQILHNLIFMKFWWLMKIGLQVTT